MKNVLLLVGLAVSLSMCSSPTTTETNSNATTEASPEQQEEALQVYAEFDARPGNVAVASNGRVFTTMHPLGSAEVQLLEVKADGSKEPFPSIDYQKNGAEASDDKIDTPLGIRIDQNNVLWIIDMGQNLGKTRIWGFDINTREEVFKMELPEDVAPAGSFVQDLAVDERNGWIYLADIANPGILVVDSNNKTVRRFADSILEAEDIDMIIDGKVIHFGGAPARVAVNPITLSEDRNTLFFGAMNGTKWYSLPAAMFRDEAADEELSQAITVVGEKPISDGVATDKDGNHYFTNLQDYGLDVLTSTGEFKPVIRDKAIDWADNVAVGNDGYLYVVVNQLHKTPAFTGAEDLGKAPFYIMKVKY